jgi:hypothetical protein
MNNPTTCQQSMEGENGPNEDVQIGKCLHEIRATVTLNDMKVTRYVCLTKLRLKPLTCVARIRPEQAVGVRAGDSHDWLGRFRFHAYDPRWNLIPSKQDGTFHSMLLVKLQKVHKICNLHCKK